MKKLFVVFMFLMSCGNAFSVACLQYDISGCSQYSSSSYTDSTGVTAMYKCGGGGNRVDVVGMCGTELSGGDIVYNTTNLNDNSRCFCRITYPFLSDWVVAGGGCYNPSAGTIGCVSACEALLNSGTNWISYK